MCLYYGRSTVESQIVMSMRCRFSFISKPNKNSSVAYLQTDFQSKATGAYDNIFRPLQLVHPPVYCAASVPHLRYLTLLLWAYVRFLFLDNRLRAT